MPLPAVLWFAATAPAADCDAAALKREVEAATPMKAPKKFAELADCDGGVAKSVAKTAVPRFLAGEEANDGVRAALVVGADAEVRDWLASLQFNDRTPTIEWLGRQCGDTPEVEQFFVTAKDEAPESFWEERWYRGLADCRTDAIQALLSDAVDEQASDRDRVRFFALLEIYARNLRAEGLGKLEALLGSVADTEVRLVVGVFADAANVGSTDGIDADAATKGIAVLHRAAASLPADAADALRTAYQSLGDDAAAEQSAKYQWPDRADGGLYRYVATAHELWTCKNGKEYGTFHFGELLEPGNRWPDTLQAALEADLTTAWDLGAAANKCGGEATLEVEMSEAPLELDDDASDWLDRQRAAFDAKTGSLKKTETNDHDPANI